MLVLVFLFGVVLPTLVTVVCFIGFLVCWYRFRYRRLALIKKCSARSRVHAVVQAPLMFDDIPVRPLIATNETARNSGFIALHPIRISACLDPAVRLTGSRRGSITTTSSLRLLSASDRSSTVSISPADDIEQLSASSEATSSFSRHHAGSKRNSGAAAAVRRTTYFRPPTSASTNQAETCGGSGLDDDNGYVLTEFIYTSGSASSDRGDDIVTPTTRTSRLPLGETRSRVSFETDDGAKITAAHTDSRKRRTVSIVDQTTSARCVTAIVHNSPGGASACFATSTVTVNEQLGGLLPPDLPASESQETIVDKFGYVDVDLLDKQLKSRGQQSAVSTSTIRSYFPAVSASNRLHHQTAVPKTLADSRTAVNEDVDDAPNFGVYDDVTLASSGDKTDITASSGCKQPERIIKVNGSGRNFSTEIYSTYRTSPS